MNDGVQKKANQKMLLGAKHPITALGTRRPK